MKYTIDIGLTLIGATKVKLKPKVLAAGAGHIDCGEEEELAKAIFKTLSAELTKICQVLDPPKEEKHDGAGAAPEPT